MLTTLIVSDKVDAEAFKEILAEIAEGVEDGQSKHWSSTSPLVHGFDFEHGEDNDGD